MRPRDEEDRLTASILAFNTETRPTVTGPDNLHAPESKFARSVLRLFQSITKQ